MSRVKVDFSTASKNNYKDFCKLNPTIELTFDQWKNIIYTFNENFKQYLLETGEKANLPYGFGEFVINKKIRRKTKGLNNEFINLPVDWKKTKEKGKIIYNFNYHTEGYYFGWLWFKHTAVIKYARCWTFKPSRITSRLLAHYINADPKYKDLYQEWKSI
jgi:nucleoid DNA-binding protein